MRSILRIVIIVVVSVATFVCGTNNQKPIFHITPPEGHWLNDPNGPFYDHNTGVFHLFAQYNPYGPTWGNMSWLHWVSKDFISWTTLPVAIYNDESYDMYGAFSGSVQLVNSNGATVPVLLYTCVDNDEAERQCIALPSNTSDPLAVKWQKVKNNPVIDLTSLPSGYNPKNFRDPTIWPKYFNSKSNSSYYVAMAAELSGVGNVALYECTLDINVEANQSVDLSDSSSCSYLSSLWSSNDPTASYQTYMVECPDLYPLPVAESLAVASESKYSVLKFSVMEERRELYEIGVFDETANHFSRDISTFPTRLEYDYGPNNNFYASKTFSVQKGDMLATKEERILWGWTPEVDGNDESRNWSGAMAFPRLVHYSSLWQSLHFQPHPRTLAGLRDTLHKFSKEGSIFRLQSQFQSPQSTLQISLIDSIDSLASDITIHAHMSITPNKIENDNSKRSDRLDTDMCEVEIGLLSRLKLTAVQSTTDMPSSYIKHAIRFVIPAASMDAFPFSAESSLSSISAYSVIDTRYAPTGSTTPPAETVARIPGNQTAWLVSLLRQAPAASSRHLTVPVDIQVLYDYSVVEMYLLQGASAATSRVYTVYEGEQYQPINTGVAVYAQLSSSCASSTMSMNVDIASMYAYPMKTIWPTAAAV